MGFETHYREVHAVFEELIHRPWGTACWSPPADVWESDEAFLIEMDLPGVASDSLQMTVHGSTLAIEGDRKVGHTEASHVAHRCERPEGRFARAFHFEEPLDEKRIEHRFSQGVLVVTLRKPSDELREKD